MRDKIFANLVGIQKEMLKLIGEVSSLRGNSLSLEDAIDDIWHPKCDVYQTDDEWIIVVELAGLMKEEISISITKEYVRISGSRALSCPGNSSYYIMEIETGRFDRRLFFPDVALDKDNPKVRYENGILRLVFKMSPQIERVIPIE